MKNKYKNEIDELKEQIKREMITRENMYQSFNKEKQLLIEDIRVNEKNKYYIICNIYIYGKTYVGHEQ